MVTKQTLLHSFPELCSVLAKIHMVTKRIGSYLSQYLGSVLAKIHMVTKPQKYGSTFLNVIEY